MASSSTMKLLWLMVMATVVVTGPAVEAAISCGVVFQRVRPCFPYVSGGGSIPQGCCSGIKNLVASAKTTPDRKAVCVCLKGLSGQIKNNPRVPGLPGQCGVSIPYKLSPSTDCNTIK